MTSGQAPGQNQITARTREGFDGSIVELPMAPGHWGPFFHVTSRRLEGSKEEMAKSYRCYARYSRVRRLRRVLRKKCNDPHKFDLFLTANEEKIELDADFSLVKPLKQHFQPNLYDFVAQLFQRTSRERWLGLTQPRDFNDAVALYAIGHLREEAAVHLYSIVIEVPIDIPGLNPVLFCGKVRDGTSMQFKLNNHAVECVAKVRLLESWTV